MSSSQEAAFQNPKVIVEEYVQNVRDRLGLEIPTDPSQASPDYAVLANAYFNPHGGVEVILAKAQEKQQLKFHNNLRRLAVDYKNANGYWGDVYKKHDGPSRSDYENYCKDLVDTFLEYVDREGGMGALEALLAE